VWHWGIVLKGKLTYRYSDGTEETSGKGRRTTHDAGHLPFLHGGTEVVEFSPTNDLQQTMEVINKNMESSS
jgi:hypothetical protein